MRFKLTREQRRMLAIENASYSDELRTVPRERWATASWDDTERLEVWRSKTFLVQIFAEKYGAERMTVSRTTIEKNGHWTPGITWDELQQLKAECGRAKKWAVELYPAEQDVVNVANMRHLWILQEHPKFGWKQAGAERKEPG